MNKEELIKKVRKIEIKTKGLSHDIFAGEYHSAFKGRGMSFSEVREYQSGDDIRDIDWNVTARSAKAHIKIYEEERELTMMLIIDLSGSGDFGSKLRTKRETAAEIAAVIAFSAAQNNDKVGCILFTDKVEKYIPPKKGRQHVLRIISEILDFKPESKLTNISVPLKYLTNVLKKRSTAFILSDFDDVDIKLDAPRYKDPLKIASKKHDIVALNIFDPRELDLPNVGLIELRDKETDQKQWVDTASRKVRSQYATYQQSKQNIIARQFTREKIDSVAIATNEDYVSSLIKLFKMR